MADTLLAFEALRLEASRDPLRATPRLREGWLKLEAATEKERLRAEAEAHAARRAGSEHAARECLSDFMDRAVADQEHVGAGQLRHIAAIVQHQRIGETFSLGHIAPQFPASCRSGPTPFT